MTTYLFNSEIGEYSDGELFTASNGNGYVENGELHIVEGSYHFIYKPAGEPAGWYMRNAKTSEDVYLGEGASPSAAYDDLVISNEDVFAAIATEMTEGSKKRASRNSDTE